MDRLPKAKTEGSKRQNSKLILLVEDNPVDAMMAKRALKNFKVTNPIVHMANGEQALEYLRTERDERLCLILLNLNMPKMNSLDFLKIIDTHAFTGVVLAASGFACPATLLLETALIPAFTGGKFPRD